MRISLDLNKSIESNASDYYEKAKKAKRKLEGAKAALERTIAQMSLLKDKKEALVKKEFVEENAPARKKQWFEKFRWFITSTGFLVVGGRDSTSNELVIKKHAEPNDIVMHTDMAGSPFFVIKTEGRVPDEATLKEVADAACSFSRAWKLNLSRQDVFYVKPEQVTKTANPGEYLQKGAFIIRGKTQYIDNKINCAVGMTKEGLIMSGPKEAVEKHCEKFVVLKQGSDKASDIAKKIKHKIGGELDEIIRAMPSGGVEVE